MGRKLEYLYKKQMRQVILGRLIFHKYSVITIMSTFTVYTRAWLPEGCHNYRAPSILIVHPLWYAAPKGAVSSLCPSHQTGLGLCGCCASPAMLPSLVATIVVIYSVVMYLALSLSQLPEFWFWEGGMWDHRVLWWGNVLSSLKQAALSYPIA